MQFFTLVRLSAKIGLFEITFAPKNRKILYFRAGFRAGIKILKAIK